jgi:hypothetical protein
MDADASDGTATTVIGASGTVAGVTAADGKESAPEVALNAETVKVYEVPLDRPVTVHVTDPVVEHDCPSGEEDCTT